MASSGLKKMLDFIILCMPKGVSENVYLSNFVLLPNSISCFIIIDCNMYRQMLLPKVMADVKAMNIYIYI